MENSAVVASFLMYSKGIKAKETIKTYGASLSVFVRWANERGKFIHSMTLDDFVSYAATLADRGLKSGTRNIYMTSVRAMWRYLHERGQVTFDEKKIPVPTANTEPYETMTPDEYRRFLSVFSQFYPNDVRDKAVFMMLWDTGARIGELMSIDLDDLDGNTLIIKTFKRKNHSRRVCLTEDTIKQLGVWFMVREMSLQRAGASGSALFIGLGNKNLGERLGKDAVQHSCARARLASGVKKKLTPHSFRHGCATDLLKSGMNLRQVQSYLGHARVNTTERYTHYTNEEVTGAFFKARRETPILSAVPA